jgi:hypothetical protein
MTIAELIEKRRNRISNKTELPRISHNADWRDPYDSDSSFGVKNPHQCNHHTQVLTRQTHGAFVMQCSGCGSTCSTSIKHSKLTKQEMEKAPLFDYKLRDDGQMLSFQIRQLEKSHGIKTEDMVKPIGYDEYLRSPEWKHKRSLVISREKNTCQGCGSKPIEEVHHSTYSHIKRELLFQLVGLCSECHRKVHNITPQ